MEQYTYFDIVKIRESLHLKMDAVKRGKELLAQKQVVLKSIDTGYINGYEETMGVIECEVKDREKGAGKRFKVHIIFPGIRRYLQNAAAACLEGIFTDIIRRWIIASMWLQRCRCCRHI